jgi:hypothetical protein
MNFDTRSGFTTYSVRPFSRYQQYPFGSYSESESESYYNRHPSYIPRPLPIARLQDERFKCDRYLGWNIDWAVAFLVNHLSSPDAADSLRRIRLQAENLFKENGPQDVACRIFNRLDQLLFAGHLKNAVYMNASHLGADISGATFTHGRGPNARVKRVSIFLNSVLLQHARSQDIVASLIHQMIHAYFLVACGPQVENEEGYGRLAHGLHFGKVMNTIKNLSSAKGKPLPLGFEHRLGPHSYYDDYYAPRPRRQQTGKWFSSHCHAHVKAIPEKEIDEWYNVICKPMLDLPETVQKATALVYNDRHHDLEEISRSTPTTPPSAASVEFLFQDKPVLVPAAKIGAFTSIRKAFDKAKSRFLAVPEEVDRDTFMRLLELVHLGRYSPDIGPVCAPGRKGPPLIKPLHHESQPFLLTDIRMFKLGAAMGFDEAKGVALQRMSGQSVTREDPVAVLSEIYDGADPDPELRAWAKAFLLKGPEADWLDGGLGGGRGIGGLANIQMLDRDMGFKTRFRDLVMRCSALQLDAMSVNKMLCAAGRVSVYGDGVGLGMGIGMARRASPPMGVGMGVGVPPPGYGLTWEGEFERYGVGYGNEGIYGAGWEDLYGGGYRY